MRAPFTTTFKDSCSRLCALRKNGPEVSSNEIFFAITQWMSQENKVCCSCRGSQIIACVAHSAAQALNFPGSVAVQKSSSPKGKSLHIESRIGNVTDFHD